MKIREDFIIIKKWIRESDYRNSYQRKKEHILLNTKKKRKKSLLNSYSIKKKINVKAEIEQHSIERLFGE